MQLLNHKASRQLYLKKGKTNNLYFLILSGAAKVYKNMFYTTIDKLRNEMSVELLHKPFNEWYGEDEVDEIKYRYPLHILEWTPEEKRLLKLLRNQKSQTAMP